MKEEAILASIMYVAVSTEKVRYRLYEGFNLAYQLKETQANKPLNHGGWGLRKPLSWETLKQ